MANELEKEEFLHLHPSQEFKERFITEQDDTIAMENSMEGQWILVYPKDVLNEKWKESVYLYRILALPGVQYLKCSTAASTLTEISFICGPYDDKKKIVDCGMNVIAKMQYFNSSGLVGFRSERQRSLDIETTGASDQYLYKLAVPTHDTSNTVPSSEQGKSKPLQVQSYTWKLSYPTFFNIKWRTALSLYRENKLTGIQSIDWTSDDSIRIKSGTILFICQPIDDKATVLKHGANLITKMGDHKQLRTLSDETGREIQLSMSTSRGAGLLENTAIKSLTTNRSCGVDAQLVTQTECTFNISSPMSEYKNETIMEFDETISKENSTRGMWMLFYPIIGFDAKWQEVIALYRARQFPGITCINCSTSAPNPRASSKDTLVMLFRCSFNNKDEESILKCGRNIVTKLEYVSPLGHVSYKTNRQGMDGTRSMGVKVNHTYSLPVPTDAILQSQDDAFEKDEAIASQYPTDMSDLGVWVMEFSKTMLYMFWERARRLYHQKELPGIAFIKLSIPKSGNLIGQIRFFSGPSDDKILMEECGVVLADKMKYFSITKKMNFEVKRESSIDILRSIDVPTVMH